MRHDELGAFGAEKEQHGERRALVEAELRNGQPGPSEHADLVCS